jgi:NAD(P)-dependent dehydrogenase (short-subunit alcohol dehydrogenase family)
MALAGKAGLVSGAGGGIGRAICLAFAEAGAAVACCDIDGASAEETARLAQTAGGRATIARPCDVSIENETEAAASAAHRAFGRLDILVSGAAPHDPSGTVLATSLADWERVLAVNLTGSFLLSRAVLPYMIATGGGSIIFVASQLGRVGSAGRAAYCATKGALIQLAKVMAIDHADQNIRVNTLSPGGVETQRTVLRYGSFEAGRQALGPKHLLAASADRKRLLQRPCFSPATHRASSPAAISWSTAAIRRSEFLGLPALAMPGPRHARRDESERLKSGLNWPVAQAVSSCSTRWVAVVSSMRSTAANSRTNRSRAA